MTGPARRDTSPHARHLVYLTAMVLDEGESATGLSATLPVVEGPAARLFRRRDDGMLEARPELKQGATGVDRFLKALKGH